jgi:hypothetical protein
MDEINVYIIENEQPFENWFGTWEFFQTINEISGFYVKNNKEEFILVDKKNVFEVDTNLPIDKFVSRQNDKEILSLCGLSNNDIESFFKLLNKIIVPEEWIDAFYHTMEDEESIPFEGGMGFSEALTGLKESLNY